MNDDVFDDIFDYENFKDCAKRTFKILFAFRDLDPMPKLIGQFILDIHRFAVNPIGGISKEYLSASLVAQNFCDQGMGFFQTKDIFDEPSENEFIVRDTYNDSTYVIDTNTFDLSPIINDID